MDEIAVSYFQELLDQFGPIIAGAVAFVVFLMLCLAFVVYRYFKDIGGSTEVAILSTKAIEGMKSDILDIKVALRYIEKVVSPHAQTPKAPPPPVKKDGE